MLEFSPMDAGLLGALTFTIGILVAHVSVNRRLSRIEESVAFIRGRLSPPGTDKHANE
jgi:hypothetical protein